MKTQIQKFEVSKKSTYTEFSQQRKWIWDLWADLVVGNKWLTQTYTPSLAGQAHACRRDSRGKGNVRSATTCGVLAAGERKTCLMWLWLLLDRSCVWFRTLFTVLLPGGWSSPSAWCRGRWLSSQVKSLQASACACVSVLNTVTTCSSWLWAFCCQAAVFIQVCCCCCCCCCCQ